MTTVLSIQSHVAYGHAGNSAAVFPLQRRGIDVWPVHTVCFSNHTGYEDWAGPLLPAGEISEIINGIDRRGGLARLDAVLSGYQGGEDVGASIVRAVDLAKERNPAALYCCDPVMGDVGAGFYVGPGIPEFLRDRVVPRADIVTPNHFELEFLAGRSLTRPDELLEAAAGLRNQGPSTILVTSVRSTDVADHEVAMVAVDAEGAWQVVTPAFDRNFTGSGDLTSAVFLSEILAGHELREALGTTASAVYGVLKATVAADSSELVLVGAQDEIAQPGTTFEVTPV